MTELAIFDASISAIVGVMPLGKAAISCCAFITGCIQSLIGSNAFWSFIALDMSGFSAFSFCLSMVIPPLDS